MSEIKSSQSIYVVLDSLKTETSVPGQEPKMQAHTLPREMFPTSKEFESETLLLDWAKEAGCLHAVMQKGIKAHLIDCRAKFKSVRKGEEWSNSYGQENLDGYKWEVQQRPSGAMSAEEKAEKAIESLSKEELLALLTKKGLI